MNILHVITGLNVGGAETMLAKLLEYQNKAGCGLRNTVVSLAAPGAIADRVRAQAKLETVAMREGVPSASAAWRLARIARRIDPDLVIGWMHHGNLAASFARSMLGGKRPLIWNVRHSVADIREEKPLTRIVLRLGAALSRSPDAILYNSSVAAMQYEGLGYDPARAMVLPNGFDCDRHRPRDGAHQALRARHGVAPEATLVGMVARLHPMKDTGTLVEAVKRARGQGADIHLLLCGRGMESPPPELARALAGAVPEDRLTLVGQSADLADWMPGLDFLVLPSAWGEGFPNTLAEAMASGVPCITTDVGDSGWIVGETGRVVEPRDAGAMAAALVDLIGMGAEERRRLGEAARTRVVENFALEQVGARITSLYAEIGGRRSGRGGLGDAAGVRAVLPGSIGQ